MILYRYLIVGQPAIGHGGVHHTLHAFADTQLIELLVAHRRVGAIGQKYKYQLALWISPGTNPCESYMPKSIQRGIPREIAPPVGIVIAHVKTDAAAAHAIRSRGK